MILDEVNILLGKVKICPDGTLKPGNNITRAEVTRILVKVQGLGEAAPGSSQFKDVNPSTGY
ncbi:MAG TPA: S-layer homology domain-containing protein [Bacillota bacterium]|nr:S-layer homology domain-containing protein [Peptococcaceae bacterium MAG4]NLW38183.1 S-layer homology domain-containing protein [Peptococcaceae bacterium]HPU35768.1 S-layer homology domain-containing protein [Bacillota bacterium]HPZ44264.1 S-layer homology domain-containing protein [Bacillota bacterium]HQD76847.1 S-layer homology domain-containing protein [Bacillota bacterium]